MIEKCLIVGLGKIGLEYDIDKIDEPEIVLTHAKAFYLHSNFDLVGAVDPSSVKRNLFKLKYKKPTYSILQKALSDLKPTIIIISSSTDKHFEILNEILANSHPKIIICEKPLAYDIDEAEKMVKLCNSYKVRLFVNYMRRSDPGIQIIKKMIETGEFPIPIKGVVWYSKGLIHNGSHFYNILDYLLGPIKNARIINAGRLWDKIDPEPDFEVDFRGGKIIFLSASEEAFSHYTIELISKTGRIRYEQGGECIKFQKVIEDVNFSGYKVLDENEILIENKMNIYQLNVVNQIDEMLKNNNYFLCSGEDALRTLKDLDFIIKKISYETRESCN